MCVWSNRLEYLVTKKNYERNMVVVHYIKLDQYYMYLNVFMLSLVNQSETLSVLRNKPNLKLWKNYILYKRSLQLFNVHAVADPGFPVGGANSRRTYISKNVYIKTTEWPPLGSANGMCTKRLTSVWDRIGIYSKNQYLFQKE